MADKPVTTQRTIKLDRVHRQITTSYVIDDREEGYAIPTSWFDTLGLQIGSMYDLTLEERPGSQVQFIMAIQPMPSLVHQ